MKDEQEKNLRWAITPPDGEIRTIIVNWPVQIHPPFKGRQQHRELIIKPVDNWGEYTASDFGLKSKDLDSHAPYLYLLRKAEASSHKEIHVRSATPNGER